MTSNTPRTAGTPSLCTTRTARRATVTAAVLALVAALLLAGAPTASAGTALDRAAAALRSGSGLYVDSSVDSLLGSQESDIRSKVQSIQTPVFVAALPVSEVTEAGSGGSLVQELAQQVDRDGTYLVVTPRGLYGVSDVLDNWGVVDTVRTAASDNGSAAPALSQALDGISSMAASGGGSSESRDVTGRSSSAGMGV